MTPLIIALFRSERGRGGAAHAATGGRIERHPERFVVRAAARGPDRSSPGAVFGVQRDRPLEVRQGFGVLAALRMRDREHVERVIVVRIFVADQPQVSDRLIVLAAVDRQRGRRKAARESSAGAASRGVVCRWQMFKYRRTRS